MKINLAQSPPSVYAAGHYCTGGADASTPAGPGGGQCQASGIRFFRGALYILHVNYDNIYHSLYVKYIEYQCPPGSYCRRAARKTVVRKSLSPNKLGNLYMHLKFSG